MKCCQKKLEAYLNNELSTTEKEEIQSHLTICTNCVYELSVLTNTNFLMSNYQNISAEQSFITSLRIIPHHTKQKASYFSLFPKEFAFSAMMVCLALYIGIFFSFNAVNTIEVDHHHTYNYHEGISLVSLLDN